MKHIKLFESFVNEDWGSSDQSIMNQRLHRDLGSPKEFPELDDVLDVAEDAVDFYWDDWPEYKENRKGLIFKAARAYLQQYFPDMFNVFSEMFSVKEATVPSKKISLGDIVIWLKKHKYKIVSSEKAAGYRKWAEGGNWDDLVKNVKEIGAEHRIVDLGSFKTHEIDGPNFSIVKQGTGKLFVHYTPNKVDDKNRRIGYEE